MEIANHIAFLTAHFQFQLHKKISTAPYFRFCVIELCAHMLLNLFIPHFHMNVPHKLSVLFNDSSSHPIFALEHIFLNSYTEFVFIKSLHAFAHTQVVQYTFV